MKRIAIGTAAAFVIALTQTPAALATQPAAPGCHVVSVVQTTQRYLLGTTGPVRTVTTTTTKCRGRHYTTSTVYGPWSAWP